MKSRLVLLSIIGLMSLFFVLTPALAQQQDPLGLGYAEASGLKTDDPRIIIARIISLSLGLLGTIALVLIIYSGFQWMTAGGNDDKVTEAKKRLGYAIIGLIIILSAYAITDFVVRSISQAATNQVYF